MVPLVTPVVVDNTEVQVIGANFAAGTLQNGDTIEIQIFANRNETTAFNFPTMNLRIGTVSLVGTIIVTLTGSQESDSGTKYYQCCATVDDTPAPNTLVSGWISQLQPTAAVPDQIGTNIVNIAAVTLVEITMINGGDAGITYTFVGGFLRITPRNP